MAKILLVTTFTNLDVALRLAEQKYSIVGTVRQSRTKQPQAEKKAETTQNFSLYTCSISYR